MVSTNRRKRFDNEKRSRKVKRKKKTNVMDEILREVFSILETLDTLQYMVELHGSIKQSVPSTESHDNSATVHVYFLEHPFDRVEPGKALGTAQQDVKSGLN
ncbi:hypothetical protein Bbelb_108930 [Branchiostoma belcheri]|nr:hypothetical protein Bbelb_108930 [Branchiostoma belcheri]